MIQKREEIPHLEELLECELVLLGIHENDWESRQNVQA